MCWIVLWKDDVRCSDRRGWQVASVCMAGNAEVPELKPESFIFVTSVTFAATMRGSIGGCLDVRSHTEGS